MRSLYRICLCVDSCGLARRGSVHYSRRLIRIGAISKPDRVISLHCQRAWLIFAPLSLIRRRSVWRQLSGAKYGTHLTPQTPKWPAYRAGRPTFTTLSTGCTVHFPLYTVTNYLQRHPLYAFCPQIYLIFAALCALCTSSNEDRWNQRASSVRLGLKVASSTIA